MSENAVVNDDWKTKRCGTCRFNTEAPRPPGVVDLKAPKIYLCRKNPPTLLFAIGQAGPNAPPQPMPLGSAYTMVDENYPACSWHEEKPKDDSMFAGFDPSKLLPSGETQKLN